MKTIDFTTLCVPTPFYVYDKAVLLEQYSLLEKGFPAFSILYSVKSNPYHPILSALSHVGCGGDAASAKEVFLCEKAGIPKEEIFYSCPGKTEEDIRATFGKCRFVADSLHELVLLNCIAKEKGQFVTAGLRINPNFTMDGTEGVPSKFGVDIETVLDPEKFPVLSHVTLEGIHIHVRSQVLHPTQLQDYHRHVLELAVHVQRHFRVTLNYINFGGGIGIPYSPSKEQSFSIKQNAVFYEKLTAEYSKQLLARLYLESGRFLAAPCGTYVTQIVDIKRSHGKIYYVVKNGANGFLRPVLAQMLSPLEGISYEPFFTAKNAHIPTVHSSSSEKETVDIVGHLCSGMDTLAQNLTVPKADIGDFVTFPFAGAYAKTLSPLGFSSQPEPTEIFI